MSNDMTIFSSGVPTTTTRRPLSELTKSIDVGFGGRRIQLNTNGTFKRIINGEQIGRAASGAINVIIVAMLAKVSRSFYTAAYDPNAKPTLPDCWSNMGETPESNVPNRQAATCAACPQNIAGSGGNGTSRACRYERRLGVMLEGDPSGDVYQLKIPAKSLYAKGNGNTHGFESYVKFLIANEHSVDYVVTTVAYDLDADTMEVNFTPVRPITDQEELLVIAAQKNPETQKLIQLTAGAVDGAKAAAPTPAPKAQVFSAPEPEPEPEVPVHTPAAPKPQSFDFSDDAPVVEEEAPPAEPVKKTRAKKTTAAPAEPEPPVSSKLASVLNDWIQPQETTA